MASWVEHAVAELGAAQVCPDVLDRVQLQAVGRQVQQGDVVNRRSWLPARCQPAPSVGLMGTLKLPSEVLELLSRRRFAFQAEARMA